jgi:hypothetical protein
MKGVTDKQLTEWHAEKIIVQALIEMIFKIRELAIIIYRKYAAPLIFFKYSIGYSFTIYSFLSCEQLLNNTYIYI